MPIGVEVRGRRFAVTKFREGYAQSEVDAFLERAAATLERAGTPTAMAADEVVQVRFNPTKFSPGYDQDEVDDFLDELRVTLGAASGETSSATTSANLGACGRRGDVPRVLPVLRVADYALFAVAVVLLVLDLAPFSVVVGMLVVSLLGGTAVQFLIFRAERGPPDGVVRADGSS